MSESCRLNSHPTYKKKWNLNKNTCVKKGQVRLIKTVSQKKFWNLMRCQVQYHQFNKWVKNIVTPIKMHVFHFTCPSIYIYIEFTFLVEIIFLKLGFYPLSRIMLPYHEIIIREDGRANKREWWSGPSLLTWKKIYL